MRTFLDAANLFYWDGCTNQQVRERLFEKVVLRSRHIDGPDVWEWDCGMPSGNPMTAVLNTWCNMVLHVAVYSDITGKPCEAFFQDVSVALMGDDNVSVPSPSIAHLWEYKALADAFSKYGYTYTTADKGDVTTATKRPITELSFLKRGFLLGAAGRFVAPRELPSLAKQTQWISRRGSLVENLEDVLAELSLHPDHIWEIYAPRVLTELRARGHWPIWMPMTGFAGILGKTAAYARVSSKVYEFD